MYLWRLSLNDDARKVLVFALVPLDVLNYIFSVFYLIEFFLRIYSLSTKKYLGYLRNPLHLVEITVSIVAIYMHVYCLGK